MSISTSKRQSILLTEDNEDVRMAITQALESHGYHVIAADCSECATQIIGKQEQGFHALISDFDMPPGKNGAELILQIDRGKPTFKLYVLISAQPDTHPVIRSLRAIRMRAPIYFLSKPFQIDDLLRILERGGQE